MIPANNPNRKTWVEVPENTDFPIQNLPFGVFRTKSNTNPRVCTALGDYVVDLSVMNFLALFDDLEIDKDIFKNRYLNDLMALGKQKTRDLRNRLADIFDENNEEAKNISWHFLHDKDKCEMLMPIKIGDYTDFYSSIEHAMNVGTMFRGKENALMPNWKHIPIGYHGRASSIVVSGTDIIRPKGQKRPAEGETQPGFGPTNLLDCELEMGFVIGKSTKMGESVSTAEAEDYMFGLILFNDWSARDIQGWEYQPLGPFLGKSFGSTVSPWVITMDALEPFRVESPKQDPRVLPYLQYEGKKNYDINLQIQIQPDGGDAHTVCNSNFKYMYWNMVQQLAHQTVNGCNINVGDMYASGTISGKSPDSYGSLLELTWRGSKPIPMPDGSERKFLKDGDTLKLKGWCEKDGVRIGFGDCDGKVLPAV
ncbi:MAG: fumarylacetoacetase [Paraglaciecola sp.]|jgi:fumarylacetoacetase